MVDNTMDLDLTEEQQLLKNSARDFFEKEFPKTRVKEMEEHQTGHDPEVWKKMADLGWLGLMIPEEYGGAEFGFMDMVILLEEMGRACLTEPFFSTAVLGGLPIINEGRESLKAEFLPKIAAGDLLIALALTEPSASYEAAHIASRALKGNEGYILNGKKLFVHDAQVADYLLCVARTEEWCAPEDGISLFLVDTGSPGVIISPLLSMADDRQNEVVFDNVVVSEANLIGELNEGWPVIQRLLDQAAVAKCAEMVGGCDWVVETTAAYARERVQYGQPIGSFQAIQHYLADMWTEAGMAKRLTYYAAWVIEQGLPCASEVATAKAWTNEAYKHCTRMGVHIHGGIGTTRDHDIGLYYRRARQAALLFADTEMCNEVVAHRMGL
jgi:alkylation response protein AidB-like acyl-CoA dehydrogenase